MRILSDKYVRYYPIASAALFESGAASQLWRMWSHHTSAGQSLLAWTNVNIALWLYLRFYCVTCPDAIWAKRTTAFSIFTNFLIIGSVAYWRFYGR